MDENIADLQARVKNLEGWQATQNGNINKVDKKVDRLQFWIMGLAASMALQILLLSLAAAVISQWGG